MALPLERIRSTLERAYRGDKTEKVAHGDPGANALKLSRSMAPRAHALLDDVRGALGVDAPVTLFRAEAAYDTAHMLALKDGLAIQFDGNWLDTLPEDCLRVVMAHELGHHLCDHGEGSKRYRRACELTADRFAVIACGLESTLRMSMLGTVGATARIELDTAAYLADCRAFAEACLSKQTRAVGYAHPEMRVRAYAKYLFSASDVHHEITGASGGVSLAEIDAALETLVGAVDEWRAGRVHGPDDDPPLATQAREAAPSELDAVASARRGIAFVSDILKRTVTPATRTSKTEPDDVDPLEEDRRELEARFLELERRARES